MTRDPHKRCTSCSITKPIAEFFPSALREDGLTDRCRPCIWLAAAKSRKDREERPIPQEGTQHE
jgi:hypothetical protein